MEEYEMQQHYVLNPLFDFQILCDTDIGLYRLIREEYYDRSIFDNSLFDSLDINFIRIMMLLRDHFNPLFIFCKKDIMKDEELDDLYRQFLEEEYDKILEFSPPTAVFNISSISNSLNKMVKVTVLCKDKREENWIKKYNPKIKCVIQDYKDFDISRYDAIYIKDIYNLLLFNQNSIVNKNIILPRYRFNLENASDKIELPIIEVAKKYYKNNKFNTVDPYKDISIPISEAD